MAKKILRNYRGEDEAMIVRSQVITDQLSNDLGDFSAPFPFINPDTIVGLQTSIDTAEALPLDSQVLANQRVLTADVNAQMIIARRALSDLDTYAEFAYRTDAMRQKVFGQDTWAAAYNDQEKMINALEAANGMAEKEPYRTDLAAKGWTDANSANLLTLAEAIRNRNRLQENAKAERPVTTQDRVVQYNSLWSQVKDISLASKVVYADNPAKLDLYKLYASSAENTTVRMALTAEDGTTPIANATVQITNTELAARTTDEAGFVEFVSVNIPELINIEVTTAEGVVQLFENVDVMAGTINEVPLSIG